MRIGVCFVCMGNICRSPTAEGVFRHLAKARGVLDRFDIDSAGLGDWHLGEPPNVRAQEVAKSHSITLEGNARLFTEGDFERFDYVVAMDHSNRDGLRLTARNEDDLGKIHLLREFDPQSAPDAEVPDPYNLGIEDYELVMDLCLRACAGLLDRLVVP
jgi:protein-tyrosine phosphatase